nr:thiamine phosphate synthase [Pedobacter sp. ASV19]
MLKKLMYISQGENQETQLLNISKALYSGCNWIQIRYKNRSESEVLQLTEQTKKMISNFPDVTLIINDHPRVALLTDAHGVHLGLSDSSVKEARALLGAHKIIGGTANTINDLLQRTAEGCDYIGLGPYRYTTTKAKLSPILGLTGYQSLFSQLKELNVAHPPVYAIGGILPEDIEDLMKTGLYGIAFSGLLSQHPNPTKLMDTLRKKTHETLEYSR